MHIFKTVQNSSKCVAHQEKERKKRQIELKKLVLLHNVMAFCEAQYFR